MFITNIIDKAEAQNVSNTAVTLLNSTKQEPNTPDNHALLRMKEYNIMVWNHDQANDVNVWLETLKDFLGLADADTVAVGVQDEVIVLDATNLGIGMSVTGNGKKLHKIQFYIKKTGTPEGYMVAKLYTHSGSFGTTSVPGTLLATSEKIAANRLTTSLALVDFFFEDKGINDNQKYDLVNTTKYVITLEYAEGDASNNISVGIDGSSPAHGGNQSLLTSAWAADATNDLIFVLITEGTLEWLPLTAAAAVGTASGAAATQAAIKQFLGSAPYLALRLQAIRASGDVTDVDALFLGMEQT